LGIKEAKQLDYKKAQEHQPEPLIMALFRKIANFDSATVCGVICGRMVMM
jgi:hypothetical protein